MYGTIADWRAYALARGDNSPTAADDDLATAALVRASDYIKFHYVTRFVGAYGEASEGVEEATYIAAGLELSKPNFFTKTYSPAEQKVLTGVDSIKWTVTGKPEDINGIPQAAPVHSMIDAMLLRYMPPKVFAPSLMVIGGSDGS